MSRRYDTNAGWGVALIAVGILFLVAQFTGMDIGRYGWSLIIVVTGLALLFLGLTGMYPSRGSITGSAVVTTVGLILLYQNTMRHRQSWAYAWALIPAAVGLSVALRGALGGQRPAPAWALDDRVLPRAVRAGLLVLRGCRAHQRARLRLRSVRVPDPADSVGAWMLVARTMRLEWD